MCKLFRCRSAYGAGVCASAAIDALIYINYILAGALGNGLYRAFACASAAGDAFVRDNICHW